MNLFGLKRRQSPNSLGAILAQYDTKFFELRSQETPVADAILSTIFPALQPKSVVDLGTAVGTWLASAKKFGATKVVGIDGPWVPADQLLIETNEFVRADLEGKLPELGTTFDLAISTEVLEHISDPAGERAVAWLTRQAPAILFSAAIPGQDGQSHINERWLSSWASRFEAHGFKIYDAIRPKIWGNPVVPFWYKQNLLFIAKEEIGDRLGFAPVPAAAVDLVHPELFGHKTSKISDLEAKKLRNRVRKMFGMKSRPSGVA